MVLDPSEFQSHFNLTSMLWQERGNIRFPSKLQQTSSKKHFKRTNFTSFIRPAISQD